MDNTDNNKDQTQGKSFEGYGAPGQDRVIESTSEAVPSPSTPSEDRSDAPDAHIGGRVNDSPGSANPALAETIGIETGQTSTADFLRARESAEEEQLRNRGAEIYEDQAIDSARRSGGSADSNLDETIYQEQEFDRPTEPDELDLMGGRGVNLPDNEESDGR